MTTALNTCLVGKSIIIKPACTSSKLDQFSEYRLTSTLAKNLNKQIEEYLKTEDVPIKSLENREFFINNLSDKDIVNLSLYLFYSKNGMENIGITDYLFNTDCFYNEDYYKKILILCDIISNRLEKVSIIKKNSYFSSDKNLQDSIRVIINQIKIHILEPKLKLLKSFKPSNNKELENEKIGYELSNLIQMLDSYYREIKSGTTNSYAQQLPRLALSNGLTDGGAAITPFANNAGGNMATLAIAGGLMGIANQGTGINSSKRCITKLQKQYLLKLIKDYINAHGVIPEASRKFCEKFLAIKRSANGNNFISKKFSSHSKRQFNKLFPSEMPKIVLNKSPEEMLGGYIEIKAKLKRYIKESKYQALNTFLDTFLNSIQKEVNPKIEHLNIEKIVFKNGNFRGNLYAHLIHAWKSKNTSLPSDSKSLDSLELAITKLGALKKEVNKTNESDFEKLFELAINLKANDRYTFLSDLENLLFAIDSSGCTSTQKNSIIQYLDKEFKSSENNPKFNLIRHKRNLLNVNLFGTAIGYQSFAVGSVIGSGFVASGLSWTGFASLWPMLEILKTGNTTTYSSATEILNYYKNKIKLEKSKEPMSEASDQNDLNYYRKYITDSMYKNENSENRFTCILRDLKKIESKSLQYVLLTSTFKGELLINKLFTELLQSKKSTSNAKTPVQELITLWQNCSKPFILSNSMIEVTFLKSMDFNRFKQYVANIKPKFGPEAFIAFYHVIAIILDKNKSESGLKDEESESEEQQKKLLWFAQIIKRAEKDKTSNWRPLIQESKNKQYVKRLPLRIIGGLIWSVGSQLIVSALVSSTVGIIPAALGLLFFNALRGLIYALAADQASTNLTNSKKALDVSYLLYQNLKYGENIDINHKKEIKDFKNFILNNKIYHNGLKELYENKKNIYNIFECYSEKDKKKDEEQYLSKLNTAASKEAVFLEIDSIIGELSKEVVDKYSASEAIVRLLYILDKATFNEATEIKNATNQDKDLQIKKLKSLIITSIKFQFCNGMLVFSKQLSRKRNVFSVYDLAYALFSFPAIAANCFHAGPILQAIVGAISDTVGLKLSSKENKTNKTTSIKHGENVFRRFEERYYQYSPVK